MQVANYIRNGMAAFILFKASISCSPIDPEAISIAQGLERCDCLQQDLDHFSFRVCNTLSSEDGQESSEAVVEFVMKIRDRNSNNNPIYNLGPQQVAAMTDYYSFGFQKDVYITDGKKYWSPVLFNFSRNYNASPFLEFAFAFDLSNLSPQQSYRLVVNDSKLGQGIVKFPLKIN